MTRPEIEQDTAHSAIVEDHHFIPPEGQPWALCQYVYTAEEREGYALGRKCNLSRAAHAFGPIADTDPGRPPSMRQEDDAEADNRPEFLKGKCMMPLDEDEEPGGDGMIYCYMPENHEGDHGKNTISERGLEAAAMREGEARAVQAIMDLEVEQEEEITARVYIDPGDDEEWKGEKVVEEETGNREETIKKEGHKDDDGKTPFFYLPWDALEDVAYVMEYGARKYAPGNYRKGMKASRLFSAAIRHVKAWWKGENLDKETKRPHLAHAVCCLLMLLEQEIIRTSDDDRYVRYTDTLE